LWPNKNLIFSKWQIPILNSDFDDDVKATIAPPTGEIESDLKLDMFDLAKTTHKQIGNLAYAFEKKNNGARVVKLAFTKIVIFHQKF